MALLFLVLYFSLPIIIIIIIISFGLYSLRLGKVKEDEVQFFFIMGESNFVG